MKKKLENITLEQFEELVTNTPARENDKSQDNFRNLLLSCIREEIEAADTYDPYLEIPIHICPTMGQDIFDNRIPQTPYEIIIDIRDDESDGAYTSRQTENPFEAYDIDQYLLALGLNYLTPK